MGPPPPPKKTWGAAGVGHAGLRPQEHRGGGGGIDAYVELQISDDSDQELQELTADHGRLRARCTAAQELWGGVYDRRPE